MNQFLYNIKQSVIARYEAISVLYRANLHGRPAYVEIASYLAMTIVCDLVFSKR
jgi:hypothetical protein